MGRQMNLVPRLKHTESTVQGWCKGTSKQPLFIQEKPEPDVLLPSLLCLPPLEGPTRGAALAGAKALLMSTQPGNPNTSSF